jgi:hypothetical protein
LRAGAWHTVAGLSAVAVVVGAGAAAVPEAGAILLPVCFALLGAASAFALDEPASLVVDVTPTSAARRTAVRALALLAPLAVGAVAIVAAVARGSDLPFSATGLALLGNVVLGFGLACAARTRTGEPGAVASTGAVLLSMAPGLVPRLPGWLQTFPSPDAEAQPSNVLWSVTLVASAVLIVVSVTGRTPRLRITGIWSEGESFREPGRDR